MSIELEVRLGAKVVAIADLVKAITDELTTMFSKNEKPEWPRWVSPRSTQILLGGEPGVVNLELAEGAEVEVSSYIVGTEKQLGEDGGFWVCLSPVARTPESICLTLVAAACLARLVESQVLDESRLIKRERWVAPEIILGVVGSTRNLSFTEAAAKLKEHGSAQTTR